MHKTQTKRFFFESHFNCSKSMLVYSRKLQGGPKKPDLFECW